MTPKYAYIAQLREQRRCTKKLKSNLTIDTFLLFSFFRLKAAMASTEKRVLVLGAGFVSGPVVEYLTRNEQVHVTAVSAIKQEADRLASRNPRTTPLLLDITRSQSELDKLIKEHDCVVSLLPYSLHPDVASLCIKHHRHMVTASYVSPKMKALHDEYEKEKTNQMKFDFNFLS